MLSVSLSVQIQITNSTTLETSVLAINYICSTTYLSTVNIIILVSSADNIVLNQNFTAICSGSHESIKFNYNQCTKMVVLIGYWDTCQLFSDSFLIPCPTTPPTHSPGNNIIM